MTPLEWIKRLLASSSRRKQIGCAWPLFFHLLFRVDEKGKWTTTYEQLSEELGLVKPTLKTWRKLLVDSSVIKSYMGKHSVTFEVLSPFCPTAALFPEGNDQVQRTLKETQETELEIGNKSMSDGMTIAPLIPLIVDLAQRITKLEMQVEWSRTSKSA